MTNNVHTMAVKAALLVLTVREVLCETKLRGSTRTDYDIAISSQHNERRLIDLPPVWVVCGASGRCNGEGGDRTALRSEIHQIRCCSKSNISYWSSGGQIKSWKSRYGLNGCSIQNLWTESPEYCTVNEADATDPLRHGHGTYEQAVALCKAAGPDGRLCYKEELESNCARGTGCGFDDDLIWSKTVAETTQGYCNYDGCTGEVQGGDWCNANQYRCEVDCASSNPAYPAVWCLAGSEFAPTTSPTSSPISSPTKSPTTAGYCNYNSCNGEVQGGAWCNENQNNCEVGCASSDPNYPAVWCVAGPGQPPTMSPTKFPTASPLKAPTKIPTMLPTAAPSKAPTPNPSPAPTTKPTFSPTNSPTNSPTPEPTQAPTKSPTKIPTSTTAGYCNYNNCNGQVQGGAWCNENQNNCEVGCASSDPNYPAVWCVAGPGQPPTKSPTNVPTSSPSKAPTKKPTMSPTSAPSNASTPNPSRAPSNAPTLPSTNAPTKSSTPGPTKNPTTPPSPAPTKSPTKPTTFSGPFITKATSSELVTIPSPPQPVINVGIFRTNCPENEAGLLPWHDAATWAGTALGRVPVEGDDVTLPLNSKVIVTQSIVEKLGVVTIPSTSELLFAENHQAGITMDVGGIEVQGAGGTRGVLRAGSETCRYEADLTITLHGSRPSNAVTNIPDATFKGISVNGGTIDFHGQRYFPTWSRLSQTVERLQDYILLQDEVNWKSGHEIVLVTTAVHDSYLWHQNEVLVVASVQNNPASGVGSVVYLTAPVQHKHIANNGYQAEVGLLTRNIKVQGSSTDSEFTDPDPGTCTHSNWQYGRNNNFAPCPNYRLTGFGGHIMVRNGGKGYVEGVELYRMGQTNVLGRYPMHFHVLGTGCTDCYIKDSSIHRSYYRCVSIHGTDSTVVSENVAFDVGGYCYYLEDGVEENNEISYNLAAHIHPVGGHIAIGDGGQTISEFSQSNTLTLPADVTASGFYLTNLHNNVIGNAASGGWSGFAMPILHRPTGPHKNMNFRPANRLSKMIDGNTAHSTGWWWGHAGAFYSGGSLFYGDASDTYLKYNAGRDQAHERSPCLVDKCQQSSCDSYCQPHEMAWNQISNSKVFLVPSTGLNSWSGRAEILGFEAHDVGLGLEALSGGFGIDNLLIECRTGEKWVMPANTFASSVSGNGFFWYDTNQEHIITNAAFRNCGYRSGYDHYDSSPTRGCDSNGDNGCSSGSTVWGFLTHSDQFTPELMQATSNISYEDCGRRFKLSDFRTNNVVSTVSGRTQNWMDVDGTASGINEPTMIGSGLSDAGYWWKVDDNTVYDPDGPLYFIRQNDGPERGLGHMRIRWNDAIHNTVGGSSCGNGNGASCPALGRIRHIGPKFDASKDPTGGLPITANPEVAGPTGGFGWLFKLDGGAPKRLEIDFVEVDSSIPMMLAITYPPGTTFSIVANAAYCTSGSQYSCQETFQPVNSINAVRTSAGNKYYFDGNTNLLWIRVVQPPQTFTGDTTQSSTPAWHLWDYNTPGKWGNGFALYRYTFNGITLPTASYRPYLEIVSSCVETSSGSGYCANTPAYIEPNICESGLAQVSYDKCGVPPPTSAPVPTSAPTALPTKAPCSEKVVNGGFDNGTTNSWYGIGPVQISADSTTSYSGTHSALITNRSSGTWNSIGQSMEGLILPGQTYSISFWVKLKNSASGSIGLTFNTKEYAGGGSTYTGLWGSGNNQGWTKVSGQKTLPTSSTGVFTQVTMYIEGPAVGVEYWVDQVSIVPVNC